MQQMEEKEERREDTFTQNANLIEGCLWLGDEDAGQAPLDVLKAHGITHILIPANISKDRLPNIYEELKYLQLFVADQPDYPIIQLFPECLDFIDNALNGGGSVLVHCAQGKSRSASVVIAYMMRKHNWQFSDALHYVKQKRPVVSTKFETQLKLWYDMRFTLEGDSLAHVKCREHYKRSPFNKRKI